MNTSVATLAIDSTGTGETRGVQWNFSGDPALTNGVTILPSPAPTPSQTIPKIGLPQLTFGVPTISGTSVFIDVSIVGGTPGYIYACPCRVALSNGQTIIALVNLSIVGPGFSNVPPSPPVSIGGITGTVTGPFVSIVASNGLIQPSTTTANTPVAISSGTFAGVPIVTPTAQVDLGDQPRPNYVISRYRVDSSQPNTGESFNTTLQGFPNIYFAGRADQVVICGHNYTSGGGQELTANNEAASGFQLEHGYSIGLLTVPAAPGLSTNATGGTVPAATYLVKVTYTITSTNGETTASSSSSITTTGSTSTITITSPSGNVGTPRSNGVGSASGWYAYVSSDGGTTYHRQQSSPTAIGTNLTLTAAPTTSGVQPPAVNTAAMSNDETHLQYVGWDGIQRRAWSAFFDWDSLAIILTCQVDQFNLWRNDNSQPFLQALPNSGIFMGDGVNPFPLNFQLNNNGIIFQKDSGGIFRELIRLNASNQIEIGHGGNNPIFLPSNVIGGTGGNTSIKWGVNPPTSPATPGFINIDALGGAGFGQGITIWGGNNTNNTGCQIDLLVGFTKFGGRIKGGRWGSSDVGARLVGLRESDGTEQAWVHANGDAPEVRLATAGVDRLICDGSGNVQMGVGALATNAANGWPYMPVSAGAPTGTPTAKTGFAPFQYDSTNNKLWIWNGSAWKGVALA